MPGRLLLLDVKSIRGAHKAYNSHPDTVEGDGSQEMSLARKLVVGESVLC